MGRSKRPSLFLLATAMLGGILLIVGIWESTVTGAIHDIALSIVLLALTGAAARLAQRRGRSSTTAP